MFNREYSILVVLALMFTSAVLDMAVGTKIAKIVWWLGIAALIMLVFI